MRKIELIELVEDYLVGGDAPADVKGHHHPEILTKHVEAAYGALILQTYLEAKKFSDYSMLDMFSKRFTLTVTMPGSTSYGYADLPFPIMQLPQNASIREVIYTDDRENAFVPIEITANTVFSELEISSIDNTEIYWVEKDPASNNIYKMYFDHLDDNTTEVYAKLIVPLYEFDDFDDVPFPMGKEGQIFDLVVEKLRTKKPEDVINDQIAQ